MNLQPLPEIFWRDSRSIFGGGVNNAINTSNPSPTLLGVQGWDKWGNRYRWALAGATTLLAGTLVSSPAANASQVGLVINAIATANSSIPSGPTVVTVTVGALVAANEYVGGQMIMQGGGPALSNGYGYTIASHPTGTTGATANVPFTLDFSEYFPVAPNTTTTVDLVHNPYNGVVISPTTALSPVVGVAHSAIVNAQYGWIGTSGLFPVLSDAGTTTALPLPGSPVSPSIITAGAFGSFSVIGDANANIVFGFSQMIGTAVQLAVSAKYKGIMLQLP